MNPKYFLDPTKIEAGSLVFGISNGQGGHPYLYLSYASKKEDKVEVFKVRSSKINRRREKALEKDIFEIKHSECTFLNRNSFVVLSHVEIWGYDECLLGYSNDNVKIIKKELLERLTKAYEAYKERTKK